MKHAGNICEYVAALGGSSSALSGLATFQSRVGTQVGVALRELGPLLGVQGAPCGHQRLEAAHLLQPLAHVHHQLARRFLCALILVCLE